MGVSTKQPAHTGAATTAKRRTAKSHRTVGVAFVRAMARAICRGPFPQVRLGVVDCPTLPAWDVFILTQDDHPPDTRYKIRKTGAAQTADKPWRNAVEPAPPPGCRSAMMKPHDGARKKIGKVAERAGLIGVITGPNTINTTNYKQSIYDRS